MSGFGHLSARRLSHLVRTREVSPVEVVSLTLEQIEAVNPALNAFVALDPDGALAAARALERRLANGEDPGPLAGVPLAVKDLEDVAGLVTTYGSPLYRDHVARTDSIQVQRLKRAGAVVIGKTNTPEFGYTLFTKNRLFGITRNPWNLERTPGGSSGGSSAAVAAGLVPLATGTDAGGSIRLPAAYCGCFGHKPSLGRIPTEGFPGPHALPTMHPISVAGPLCRCAADAALYLDVVAGYHPRDPGSLPALERACRELPAGLPGGTRIAFSPDLGGVPVQEEVGAVVSAAVETFAEFGGGVDYWSGSLPETADSWSRLLDCDLYAQLRRDLEQRPEGLSRSLATQLDAARSLGIEELLSAQQARGALNDVLEELFDRHDLLLTPTVPNAAFAAAGPPPAEIDGVAVSVLQLLGFTQPFNFSGHPAASVPAGTTRGGLPVGLQIVAPRQRDDLVLRAAYAFQCASGHAAGWPVAPLPHDRAG